MYRFSFQEYGRVYIPVYIKPIKGITLIPFTFKADTGADKTTISKDSLADLGYDTDWIIQNAVAFNDEDKPVTASGEKVNAGYVQLPLINILGYEGKRWPFQIVMDADKDFRNLLGRDLLAGFNYCFNNEEDVFSIEIIKTYKPRYKFLPDQELNEIVM
jgi:hypothetical protein